MIQELKVDLWVEHGPMIRVLGLRSPSFGRSPRQRPAQEAGSLSKATPRSQA
jgi:hypothetical protein